MSLPKDFEPRYGQKQNWLSSAEVTRLGTEFLPVLRRNALANDVKDIVLGRQLRPDSLLNVQYEPESQQKPVHSEVTGLDYVDNVYGILRMKAEETRKALEEVQEHEKQQRMQTMFREMQLKALQHQADTLESLLGEKFQPERPKRDHLIDLIEPKSGKPFGRSNSSYEELHPEKERIISEKRWPKF